VSAAQRLPDPLVQGQPLTALAPMQDVTDLAFMRVVAAYGAPDYFFTEFFRVHAQSRPERHILRSIDENDTGRPVFAQMIGEDIPHMVRTAQELARHPVAGIDVNLGCPAPKVYKKNVGGGLLRDPERIGAILAALREAVPGLLTVKMRIGFEDTANFDRILDIVGECRIDLLTVHGRTVREMYRSEVHYDRIAHAAARSKLPGAGERQRHVGGAGGRGRPGDRCRGRHDRAPRDPQPVDLQAVPGALLGAPPGGDHAPRCPRVRRAPLQGDASPGGPRAGPRQQDEEVPQLRRPGGRPQGRLPPRHAAGRVRVGAVRDLRSHLLVPGGEFAPEPHPGVIARPNCETPEEADGCSLETVTA
jgi:tRNA-dihydrouridine synthase B